MAEGCVFEHHTRQALAHSCKILSVNLLWGWLCFGEIEGKATTFMHQKQRRFWPNKADNEDEEVAWQRLQEAENCSFTPRRLIQPHYHHRSYAALVSHLLENDEHLWENIPVPSVADPYDSHLLKPKTLLDCCQCAQEFLDKCDLSDGYDKGTLYLMRVYGHRTRMPTQFQYLQAAAERNVDIAICGLWSICLG